MNTKQMNLNINGPKTSRNDHGETIIHNNICGSADVPNVRYYMVSRT